MDVVKTSSRSFSESFFALSTFETFVVARIGAVCVDMFVTAERAWRSIGESFSFFQFKQARMFCFKRCDIFFALGGGEHVQIYKMF